MNDEKQNKSQTGLVIFAILLALLLAIGYFKLTGSVL